MVEVENPQMKGPRTNLKVILLGDAKVGKSSIIEAIMTNSACSSPPAISL